MIDLEVDTIISFAGVSQKKFSKQHDSDTSHFENTP